jgi:hypothetical protein
MSGAGQALVKRADANAIDYGSLNPYAISLLFASNVRVPPV